MTTKAAKTHPRISVILSPGQSPDDTSVPTSAPPLPPDTVFPILAIAHDDHPSENAWAGLAEGAQIPCEAEAHKGDPLTQEELHAVLQAHQDTYEPRWNWQRVGITTDWMAGFEHGFMLYNQQRVRDAYPEPVHGIGLVQTSSPATSGEREPRALVQFRKATFQVADPAEFREGQYNVATLSSPQELWAALRQREGLPTTGVVTATWCFDELLDLVAEGGNYGLNFVMGYVLGLCEGVLSGRTHTPARIQAEDTSVSFGASES